MTPGIDFDGLADDIARTADYHAVALEVQRIADQHPRRLIETLAADLANILLKNHALIRVEVLVEKFILPDTECVAVRAIRNAKPGS
jgi:dihydroneopterin aldolase